LEKPAGVVVSDVMAQRTQIKQLLLSKHITLNSGWLAMKWAT